MDVETIVVWVDGAIVGHGGSVGDVVGGAGDDHLVRGVIARFVLVDRQGRLGMSLGIIRSLGEILPHSEGEVADREWFGVELVRNIARLLAPLLRGAGQPFVNWDIVC